MIILYRSLWYGQRISSRWRRRHEMLAASPKLFLPPARRGPRNYADSRKIKKAIAWKSKIAESNGAWKWNPRLLLFTLWKSFLDIGKRREKPSLKGELIDYKPIICSRTQVYLNNIFAIQIYIFYGKSGFPNP